MKTFRLCITAVLGMALVSGFASAQTTDVFWTNYFSNNNIVIGEAGKQGIFTPEGTLRITNPGLQGGARGINSAGTLCAMIYVFSADQQLNECCGCLVTPNGLQTADVKTQLTSNTLTGRTPNDGVIQVVSAAPNSTGSATAVFVDNSSKCDPTRTYTPTPDLRVWVTHIQNQVPPGITFPETEGASLPTPLSASEQGWLKGACNFAVVQGSGQGICDCGLFEK